MDRPVPKAVQVCPLVMVRTVLKDLGRILGSVGWSRADHPLQGFRRDTPAELRAETNNDILVDSNSGFRNLLTNGAYIQREESTQIRLGSMVPPNHAHGVCAVRFLLG